MHMITFDMHGCFGWQEFVRIGAAHIVFVSAQVPVVWLTTTTGSDRLFYSIRILVNLAHCRVVQCMFVVVRTFLLT